MTKDISRRNFAKLTGAALGGIMAGAMIGCNRAGGPPETVADADGASDDHEHDEHAHDEEVAAADDADVPHDPKLLLEGKNVCRGLNHTCKGHKGGDNACAGQGTCATANEHGCHGDNECKGQGGCGEHPGQNACKGKGECAVPLMDGAWEKARKAFEREMTAAGKSFGPPPEKE